VRPIAVAAILATLCAGPAAAQVAARGAALVEPCLSCHSLDANEEGLPGPSLAGLGGRPVGSAPGFDYSPALAAARSRGVRWDAERLATFLADPDSMFPGTWMSPPGRMSEVDRRALAAYLLRND
jgi:cytochrome c